MQLKTLSIRAVENVEPPKIFWKYFDLYRRKKLTLADYTQKTGISEERLEEYLANAVEKELEAD